MTTISEQLTRSFDGGAHVVDAMQYIVNQLDLATGNEWAVLWLPLPISICANSKAYPINKAEERDSRRSWVKFRLSRGRVEYLFDMWRFIDIFLVSGPLLFVYAHIRIYFPNSLHEMNHPGGIFCGTVSSSIHVYYYYVLVHSHFL